MLLFYSIICCARYHYLSFCSSERKTMKPAAKLLPALVVLAVLMCPVKMVSAQVLDPKTLSAEWWQWAFSIPYSVNPLLVDGKCMIGQRGPVWFLAGDGSGSGQAITRTCDVPEGATLFFPVINFVDINTPPTTCGQKVQNAKDLQAEYHQYSVAANSTTVRGCLSTRQFVRRVPGGHLFPCGRWRRLRVDFTTEERESHHSFSRRIGLNFFRPC